MQNFGRFYTIFDVDREYLRNEYIQNRKDVIENDSSDVRRNKSGELWSTNK